MELDSNQHSVFFLRYHLVMAIKYKQKVITQKIAKRIQEIGEKIAPNYNIHYLEYNYEKDHVHILFGAHPNTSISKYINAFKSASSRLIKKEFPEIRKKLWKEGFWSKSYCIISVGGASLEVLKTYIQNQKSYPDKEKT